MDPWGLRRQGILDEDVLRAMATVPRHKFVPQEYSLWAYDDRPLPIGQGQTISQPYIVALMTQLLELQAADRVLEIGTGSGYQTAILAEIAGRVYTVEVIGPLAEKARETLSALGYQNVSFRVGDGFWGWPEEAPFDAVIVTAAAPSIPGPLLDQLADGGRMVVPCGPPGDAQTLKRLKKAGREVTAEDFGGVVFVPFVRA